MPLDAAGFRALRGAEILEQLRTDFQALSGVNPDWERDTLLGPLTAAVSVQLGNLASLNQAIYDARDPENATGVALSNIARIGGISPIDATYSTFEGTITGAASKAIGAGQLRVRVDGLDWVLLGDVTLSAGGSGVGTFQAVSVGAFVATYLASVALGTLTIQTPLFGVDAVVVGDLTIGRDPETDAALYVRWRQSLQVRGSRSTSAIRARILNDVPTVTGCIVLENDQPTIEIIEGLTLEGPVVAVVIDPTQTPANEKALAESLYGLVAAGIRLHGTTIYVISGVGASAKTVRWTYGGVVNATLSITIRMEPATPGQLPPPTFAEASASVAAALEIFRAGLGLGEDLTLLDVQGIAHNVDGVRTVTAITLASSPVDSSKIDVDGNLRLTAAERIGTLAVTVIQA